VYRKFYGFQREPFELVPDPDFLYLGETHESALANLVQGIEAGKGFIAITGPVGTGKTTVLRAMLRRLGPDRRVCLLTQGESGEAELLRAILAGFGHPTHRTYVSEMRQKVRSLLVESEKPGILIVDEAHLLTEETLEQIRLLSNLEEDKRKLLQIVLSGQPEMKKLLSTPRLRPLTQRIEYFYEIRPLEADETREYIQRRTRIAGGPRESLFDDRAVRDIHRATGGVPRLINVLAERCLITGYVAGAPTIGRSIVREAYEDLGEVTRSVMPGETDRSWGPPGLSGAGRAVAGIARWQRSVRPPRRGHAASTRFGEQAFAIAALLAIAFLAIASLGSEGRVAPPVFAAMDRGPQVVATVPGEAAPDPTPESASLSHSPPEAPSPEAAVAPASRQERSSGEDLDGLERFTVHVASFREMGRARMFAGSLGRETGETLHVFPAELETGVWYRVLLGSYPSAALARERLEELQRSHDFSFLRVISLSHPEADNG
jgi:general secretion pathway protein A